MKHFKITEFANSNEAKRLGIDNTPDGSAISKIELLVREVLDPARELLGKPIIITSGFRSEKLNKAIGGSNSSQHMTGEAADMTCYNNLYLYELIKNNLLYDQLIYETSDIKKDGRVIGKKEWVHCSYRHKGNRKQAFKMHNGKTI